MRQKRISRNGLRSTITSSYTMYGDFFKLRQKTIKDLITAQPRYIVFLDEDDELEWSNF